MEYCSSPAGKLTLLHWNQLGELPVTAAAAGSRPGLNSFCLHVESSSALLQDFWQLCPCHRQAWKGEGTWGLAENSTCRAGVGSSSSNQRQLWVSLGQGIGNTWGRAFICNTCGRGGLAAVERRGCSREVAVCWGTACFSSFKQQLSGQISVF